MATDAKIISEYIAQARYQCPYVCENDTNNSCFESNVAFYYSSGYTAHWVCEQCDILLEGFRSHVIRMKDEFWYEYSQEIMGVMLRDPCIEDTITDDMKAITLADPSSTDYDSDDSSSDDQELHDHDCMDTISQ